MGLICKERITLLRAEGFVTFEKGCTIDDVTDEEADELIKRRLVEEPEALCGNDYNDIRYISIEEIKKIKKKISLIDYGISIGIVDLKESMKLDEIQNAIIDYIQETENKEEINSNDPTKDEGGQVE